jgi:putative phosphoesterase
MRILVISDLHGNWPAVEAVLDKESYDHLIVCGDLVSYGPFPGRVIDFVRAHAALAIRGNHDHALATGTDCRCSPASRPLALPTLACHASLLSEEQLQYLRRLPYSRSIKLEGYTYHAVHASPRNRLYRYTLTPDASDRHLAAQVGQVRADFVLLGHTHLPMVRKVKSRLVVNPGGLGQPRDGDPRAPYAVIEDGEVTLGRARYDVERTVDGLRELPLDRGVIERLAAILRLGKVPPQPA